MTKEEIKTKDYSIVIPAYNEEKNLSPLIERIEQVMTKVGGKFEIIIVDNGSFDSSPEILADLIKLYKSLVVVTLSRNFGYDGAISAGLEHSQGSWIIIMDGDQQDPPEDIPRFISKAKEGYDIVYGIREKRTEGILMGIFIKVFYRFWEKIVPFNVPRDAGNFGVISKKVVDIINNMPERNKFIRGLRAWTGFPSAGLVYQRVDRTLGKTKFSFFKYLNHAVNGITSFSTFPLRLFSFLGITGIFICVFLSLFFLITKIFELLGYKLVSYDISSGFTALSLLILFGISLNLIGMGVLGEYIGSIFREVKHRPNFIVSKIMKGEDSQKN